MKLLIPPPIQGIIVGLIMWAISQWTPGLSTEIIGGKALALIFGGVGIVMEIIAAIAFIRAKTTVTPLKPEKASRLVVEGLYRISRNPMYLGLLLLLIAWGLWLANPLNIAVIAGWVFYITEFQIKPEEKALREKFGDDYEAYCKRVRRWI